MEFSKEKMKQIRRLMLFATVLILLVIYSKSVFGGIVFGMQIVRPFLYGGIIAFVLNLPMKWIENCLLKKWKGRLARKLKRPLSMVLSVVAVVLLVTVVVRTVVPQISTTISELGKKIPTFTSNMINELEKVSKNYPELEDQVAELEKIEIDWDSMIDSAMGFLKNGVGSMLTSTVSVASNIVGGIINLVIAFIFALYILSQKEKLANQGKRVLTAYLPETIHTRILQILQQLNINFSNFITGQCMEAVILGAMFILAMTIFDMPYAFMVGVLIGFTSLIPVVGAFIGCIVGAFLILIENPILAFWFVVMFLIIQQIEGNLIYPKVVGNSVGLPSIWVLAAVSIGGSMFGVAGILFFIPLLATAYSLLRDSVNKRNAQHAKSMKPVENVEVKKDVREEKIAETRVVKKSQSAVKKRK